MRETLPLADVLALNLPTGTETAFLRACLLEPDAARAALADWLGQVGDPRLALMHDSRGLKALLPLLYDHLRASGLDLSAALSVYLKSAYLREELRGETFRRLSDAALRPLAEAQLRVLPVGGVALVPLAYEGRWALRHCHDVDLLVDAADLPRAETLLRAQGFRTVSIFARRDLTLQNDAGLTISLHDRALSVATMAMPFDELWSRAQWVDLPGGRFRVLCAEDMLLRLAAHAFLNRGLNRLHWPSDLYRLLDAATLDWDSVIARAESYGLALPLAAALNYGAGALSAPVPAGALDRLNRLAADTPRSGLDALIYGIFVGRGLTVRQLRRLLRGSPSRAILLRWLLLPSPVYLRAVEQRRGPLPLVYVLRPLRVLRQWLRVRLRSASAANITPESALANDTFNSE